MSPLRHGRGLRHPSAGHGPEGGSSVCSSREVVCPVATKNPKFEYPYFKRFSSGVPNTLAPEHVGPRFKGLGSPRQGPPGQGRFFLLQLFFLATTIYNFLANKLRTPPYLKANPVIGRGHLKAWLRNFVRFNSLSGHKLHTSSLGFTFVSVPFVLGLLDLRNRFPR